MKAIIDLEDLKSFIKTVSDYPDEWYGPQNYMTGDCICEFLEWNNKKKIAKEFRSFLDEEIGNE
jgi:hypothetical protein